MNRRAQRIMGTGCILLLAMLARETAALDQDDEKARTRFESQRAAAWRRLDCFEGNFSCEGTMVSQYGNNSKVRIHNRFSKRGAFACLEQHYLDLKTGKDTGKSWIICRGPESSFFLERKTRDQPFLLLWLGQPGQPERESAFTYLNNFLARICASSYSAMGGKLPDVVANPAFQVVSVREEGGIVTLDYALSDPEELSHHGTIALDPTLDWAVARYDIQASRPGSPYPGEVRYHGENEFTRIGNGVVPNSFKHQSVFGTKVIESHEWVLENARFDPIDDRVFSMAHHGLPNVSPRGAPPGRMGWAWPLGIALAIAVVSFVGLRVLASRQRHKAESSSA